MKIQRIFVFLLVTMILMVMMIPALADDKIEPVDYNDLKKILPSKVGGYKLIDDFGGRKSMFMRLMI